MRQVESGNHVKVISTTAFYMNDDVAEKFALEFCEGNSHLELLILNLRLRKFEWGLVSSYGKFVKLLKNDHYDVIVFHTTLDTTLPLMLAGLFSSAKKIYFNHGVPALGYNGIIKVLLNFVEQINIQLSDRVFTVGRGMFEALQDISPKLKPVLIEPGSACGVDLITQDISVLQTLREEARHRLGFLKEDKIVIYVGRPVKRKGIFDLIRAWKLIEKTEKYRLILVGPETEDFDHSEFKQHNITTTGYIKDVAQYYLCADVLCVPSYHEGLGYTYLEAATAGCMPISSDIVGPTDFVVAGETGLTVTPGNAEQLAGTLSDILVDDVERKRMSENAFYKVLNFDQRIVAEQVAQALIATV